MMNRKIGQFALLMVAVFLFTAPMIPLLMLGGCKESELPKANPVMQSDGMGSFQPEPQRTDTFSAVSESRQDLGGVSRSPHYEIAWGPDKAQPIDVLESTMARLQHVQQTVSASNENAKALFYVMMARDVLAGESVQEVTREQVGTE